MGDVQKAELGNFDIRTENGHRRDCHVIRGPRRKLPPSTTQNKFHENEQPGTLSQW